MIYDINQMFQKLRQKFIVIYDTKALLINFSLKMIVAFLVIFRKKLDL
jgi:hypothetical protein